MTLKDLWRRFRKLLFAIAVIVLAVAFIQTLPAEMAFWAAGETLVYLGVVAGVWIAASLAAASSVLPVVKAFFQGDVRRWRAARRRRTQGPRLPSGDSAEDEPAGALAFA